MPPSSISSNSKTQTVRVKRFKVSEDSSCYLLLDVKNFFWGGGEGSVDIFFGVGKRRQTLF